MAKLLNKKERVFDLKLTNYGHYLLSIGKFKPDSYAFFDDNIIYDGAYSNISESQNQIHTRIKDETPYIESLVLFENVDKLPQTLTVGEMTTTGSDGSLIHAPVNFYASDITPTQYTPRKDTFKFDSAIGDALLDGRNTNVAPAWKVVALNSTISGSAIKDNTNPSAPLNIPQININASYKLEIKNINSFPDTSQAINNENRTELFVDDTYIQLTPDEPLIYIDEVNTELLTENFDIEVFAVETTGTGSAKLTSLTRKYFETKAPQVVDGMMVSGNPIKRNSNVELTDRAVEHYFDFVKDKNVNTDLICKQLQTFNKSSYYIDLDVECEKEQIQNVYNDIYGSEVEPEICLD